MNILGYLLIPLIVIACKKESPVAMPNLPEPDTAITGNAYYVVTAASSISLDTGTTYRLGLAVYASFFKFDRSIKNGNLYYQAILESKRQFKPLKFYMVNNGSGEIVAIATPTQAEVEKFNEEWERN